MWPNRRFARSSRLHKEDPDTVATTKRSGNSWGQHGPTREDEELRTTRDRARSDFHSGIKLATKPAPGKSRDKGWLTRPLHWNEITSSEWGYLTDLWNRTLKLKKEEAEAAMRQVEAKASPSSCKNKRTPDSFQLPTIYNQQSTTNNLQPTI